MVYLKKRGIRGIWYCYWRENGRKVGQATGTADRQAAEEWRIRKAHSLLSRKAGYPIKDGYWDSFVTDYLQYSKANKARRSYIKDIQIINTFNSLFPIKYFSQYTFELLNRYKERRRVQGKKDSTINRELHTLKNMGRIAVLLKYAEHNPVADVKTYPQEQIIKERYLSLEEISRILDAVESPQIAAAVRLGLYGALRLGESLHLTWDDCDFERDLIYITGKDGWRPKNFKAKNVKQFVPMNMKLKEFLLDWKKRSQSKYVCGYENGRVSSEESACVMIIKIMRRLGIQDATSHTLRHTALSWAAMSGVDFYSLVRMARHSDPRMTMRYAHLHPEFQKNNLNKLPY